MTKRKDKNRKTTPRSAPKPRRRQEAQTPAEILDRLTTIWTKEMGKPRAQGEATRRFFGISIGTLVTAKLYLRLGSHGDLKFTGDSKVLDQLEQYSNKMADECF